MNLQLLPQALPPTSYRRSAVSRPKKPVDIKIRDSTFSDESPTWVPRPPPEDVHKLLEDFFAEHDLDKPVRGKLWWDLSYDHGAQGPPSYTTRQYKSQNQEVDSHCRQGTQETH